MAHLPLLGELVTAWTSRRPVVGVAIGLAGLVTSAALVRHDAKVLSSRASLVLEDVTLAECAAGSDAPVRWVRLLDGRLRCDLADVRERGMPDRWIFGRIEQGLVPIEDAEGRTPVVARFEGRRTCDAVARDPLVGLMGSDENITGWLTPTMLGRIRGPEPLVLAIGASPGEPWKGLATGGVLLLSSSWLVVHFVRRWLRQRPKRSAAWEPPG